MEGSSIPAEYQPTESTTSQGGADTETPAPTEPLAEGSTPQEQATGEASTTTDPPAGEPGTLTFEEQQAQAAAIQSPAELQVVPEQRPTAVDGAGVQVVSEASKRLDGGNPPSEQDYETANSDQAKEDSIKNSRTPNLVVGQRVVITEPHSEAGRMAYVLQVVPVDGIQGMLMNSGTPEARFAEVLEYVVRTRDGRSDTLSVPPDQLSVLEVQQGWGRGQI